MRHCYSVRAGDGSWQVEKFRKARSQKGITMNGVRSSKCGALSDFSGSAEAEWLVEPEWYCVRSQRKREHFAAAYLQQIAEVEVFNPQLRLVRATRRGRVWSTESLFPNYLFARFPLEKLLEKVRYTPSV